MDTSTVIWIVVAVVVVLIAAAVIWTLQRQRTEHRRVEADNIREEARKESFKIGQREALADETAAKARTAAAEADAKSAEAARLQQRAGEHSSEAASAREELDGERARADRIDPDSGAGDTAEHPRSDRPSSGAERASGVEGGRESARER